MNCPHINEYENCEDCPDYPCPTVLEAAQETDEDYEERRRDMTDQGPEPWSYEGCAGCPVLRNVADFIRIMSAEEAWATGDSDHFHELYCGKR